MARRAKAYKLKWPVTPQQWEHVDTMLQSLFDDTNNGTLAIRASQINLGTIGVEHGGTGLSSFTIGDIVYASASTTLAGLHDVATGNVLTSGGVGVAPAWAKVNLATMVTGTLLTTNGGTGFASYTVGDILFAGTTSALSKLNDVAAGAYLRSGGVATAPVWSSVALPNAAAVGDLWQASTTSLMSALTAVSAGSYLRSGGANTVSVWSTVKIPNTSAVGDLWQGTTAVNTITALASVAAGSYLRSAGVTTANVWSTLTLPNTSAQGDIFLSTAANAMTVLNKDTTATRYLSNTGASNNPAWAQVALATGVSGTLAATNGGTGLATLAQGDLLFGSAANTWSALAKDANATRYLSNTGATNNPAWAQINLANGVTGTLPATNGGSGFASYAVGDILYADTTTTLAKLADVAVGALLGSGGVTTAPSWLTAGVLSTSLRTPLVIGGTGVASPLNLQATTAIGASGADIIFLGGNNGATELGRLTFEGRLGLGTLSAPTATIFEAHGDATVSPVLQSTISIASAASSAFRFRKSRGTKASPTKTLSGDDIGAVVNAGYEEVTPAYTGTRASLVFSALEDFTNAANGTSAKLRVTPIGSTTVATQMTITSAAWTIGSMVNPALTGVRYLCIDPSGIIQSSTVACVGT